MGVEFYSLSKSYNLTGARISFVIGKKEIVEKFRAVRTRLIMVYFCQSSMGQLQR